jgi:GNAT superfamily N-acetyltransferase
MDIAAVPGGSDEARWAMAAYFAELDARFPNGFDPGDAIDEAAALYNPPTGLFLVARVDGETAGCGGVVHLDATTAEIKRMWVAPPWRGRGVGRAILAALERHAHDAGRTRIVLDTNGTLLEARAMYEAAGYSTTERYNDNPYAEHWYVKEL